MTSDCAVGQWTFVSRLPIMKKINYLGESTLVPLELKSTINLPRTGFPMKANLAQNEPKIMARWEQMRIYERIREVRKGAPVYVLHDGPPYANGPIHLGTAMNKCLKDFIVKSKSMSGFDSPYVPGWDCHGLPIEIKVDQQLGGKKLQMRPVDVRAECRKYAEKYVDLQRQQFKRIGVFGRWDEPYSTMTPQYESAVVAELYAFLEKGSVYKGVRSVYWCIHDETALAEAEVEYENHTSPTVWVKYPLRDDPAKLDPGLREKKVFTVIWTTTPWTLPASMAVAFHPDEKYVALESEGEVYIVAEKLAAEFSNKAGLVATHKLAHFPGKKLEYLNFAHPFLDRAILGVVADYVTMDTGTGVVHTAPSHGAEDFATGVKYKLDLTGNVDEKGIMRNGLPEYDGKQVFAANEPIVELLKKRGVLMHAERVEHSYPHCWRCHNPVIFRSTEQWFISMETPLEGGTLRSRTLDEIKKVKWDPAWGEERISNMIATRPDWCISRQRVWGVPIAVFLCEGCGKPLNDPALNRKVIDFFGRFGGEIVRLWAASVDFREDVVGSEKVMQQVAENYRTIRNNLFRYVLSNLYDFDPQKDVVAFERMDAIDQYMLRQTCALAEDVVRWYGEFTFHKIYHRVITFCVAELSKFYFDVLKDRLYIYAPDSRQRRAAQTAIWRIGEALVRLLAPSMSFTCEEVWQYLPKLDSRAASVHLEQFPTAKDILGDARIPERDTKQQADWETLLAIREQVNKALDTARNEKLIGKSVDAQVQATAADPAYSVLKRYEGQLRYLFIVSAVTLAQGSGNGTSGVKIEVSKAPGKKCERCWNYSTRVGENPAYPTVCERCSAVLKEIEAEDP